MFRNKEALMQAVIGCLPHADQIKDLDFTSEGDKITFTWRGNKLRITLSGLVEERDGSSLTVTDLCILLAELLKREWVKTL